MIHDILQSEIDSPTEVEQFNRAHIFYDLKNIIKEKYPSGNTLDIYYAFSLYEKCLRLCREERFNLARYWFEKVNKLHSSFSPDLVNFLDILYSPALAFYHYKIDEFETALSLLEQEMKRADTMLYDKESLRIEFKLEQLINKFRILHKAGKKSEATSLAKSIINFIINDSFFADMNGDSILSVKSENLPNYINWRNYLVNNIILRFRYDNELSFEEKLAIYTVIFSNVPLEENEDSLPIKNAFSAIIAYSSSDMKRFLYLAESAIEMFYLIPKYLQVILLDLLIEAGMIDIDLSREYSLKVLGIKAMVNEIRPSA